MRTKMWALLEKCVDSQKQDERKRKKKHIPLLSNTNALNQAGPMLQAMVFTGELV